MIIFLYYSSFNLEVELLGSEDLNYLQCRFLYSRKHFYCMCLCVEWAPLYQWSHTFGNWNCLLFQKKFPHNVRVPSSKLGKCDACYKGIDEVVILLLLNGLSPIIHYFIYLYLSLPPPPSLTNPPTHTLVSW